MELKTSRFSSAGQAAAVVGFEGLLGCLRPVWNIIGKAYSTDYKLQQQGKQDTSCVNIPPALTK